MKRIETFNDDGIRFRQPAGIGTFIGLVFFFGGLGAAIFLIFKGLHINRHVDGSTMLWLGLIGLFLLGVFFRYVSDFTRIAVTVDRRAGTVTPGRGFVVPFDRRPLPLDSFDKLVINWFAIKYTRHTEIFYILSLATPDGSLLRIGKSSSYQPIRNMAEAIGQFVHLGVLDAHTEPAVFLPAETLGRSLVEQAALAPSANGPSRKDLRQLIPTPPPDLATRWSVRHDTLTLQLPPRGYGCFIAFAVILATFGAGAAYEMIVQHIPWGAFAFFGSIATFVLLVFYSGHHPNRTTFDVSPSGIQVTSQGIFFTSHRAIDAKEIREIRTDVGTITIHLRETTLAWQLANWRFNEIPWIEQAVRCALGASGTQTITLPQ